MFTACIYCNSDLERNEALEIFPVGRRIAFDAAQGRLWVVCRKCERWNLSPLEERWEAIEQAERRFRDSRLRVSSDNVGLARLREGLDLIRIGAPQRPEMAAWRYGDQFGRRRKRQLLTTGAIVGGVGVVYGAVIWVGAMGALSGFMWNGAIWDRIIHGSGKEVVARVNDAQGNPLVVDRQRARMTVIERGDDNEQLRLRLEHLGGRTLLTGDVAMRAAAQLLPTVNRFGGSKQQVQTAVEYLENAGGATQTVQLIQQTSGWREGSSLPKVVRGAVQISRKVPGALHALSAHQRLALEMALHEESERRAMDGELAELERAWREAEEVAHIADTLLDTPNLEQRLKQLKDKPEQ